MNILKEYYALGGLTEITVDAKKLESFR